jgi:hypothetical protein
MSKFNFFNVVGENIPEIGVCEPGGGIYCSRMAQEGCRAIFSWKWGLFLYFFDFSPAIPELSQIFKIVSTDVWLEIVH